MQSSRKENCQPITQKCLKILKNKYVSMYLLVNIFYPTKFLFIKPARLAAKIKPRPKNWSSKQNNKVCIKVFQCRFNSRVK